MKKIIIVFCIIFFSITHSVASAECENGGCYPPNNEVPYYEGSPYYDCQEGCYRYCPQPGCYPSAPACGFNCGVSACAIAFSIALIAGVAILIVTVSQESSTVHAPNL